MTACGVDTSAISPNPPTTVPPTATPVPPAAVQPTVAPTKAPAISAGKTITDVIKTVGPAPFKTVATKDDKGRAITKLEGFDLNEFGGNDNLCTKKELEQIHIGERVGSVGEPCKIVVEWSLKYSDQTIITGVYALEPGEWFYVPLAVAGQKGSPRIVGTAHYLPKLWNAHMYSANIASVRDATDHTTSIVGLSPTNVYVVMLANALLGK